MPSEPARSAKEKILDAFQDILIESGESTATIEAVATRAGMSKGGFLYHYPNKAALIDAFADRLHDRAMEDVALMASAPEGATHYYLRTSAITTDTYGRVAIAATRLDEENRGRVRAIVADVQQRILTILERDTGSETAARALLLIGDGLYYNALTGGIGSEGTMPELIEDLYTAAQKLSAEPDTASGTESNVSTTD